MNLISSRVKGVYRTGCKPAKVANDTLPVGIVPVRDFAVQPKVGKAFNALGRQVPATEARRKYPAIRTFTR